GLAIPYNSLKEEPRHDWRGVHSGACLMSVAPTLSGFAPFSRRRGPLDALFGEVDRVLRVLTGAATASRPNPAEAPEPEPALTEQEKRHAAGLMRVSHVGEVCAQALYRGQAAACRDEPARK